MTVRLDTPDAGWSVAIEQIYRLNDTLVVLSDFTQAGDMAAQVISTVADSVSIPAVDPHTRIQHYVLGRTWNWGEQEHYSFIENLDPLQNAIQQGELIYERE